MNTIRPRPYPQRGTGSYNAGNDGTDKDGHNSNGQEHQQQGQQTLVRGRADEIQQVQGHRAEINSPANAPYSQRQVYSVQTPPPMRPVPISQVTPQQYQSIQAQAGYQSIPTQEVSAPKQIPQQRNNRVNVF